MLLFYENPALLAMMRHNPPAVAFGSVSSSLLFLALGFFPWAGLFPEALSGTLPRDWKNIHPSEKLGLLFIVWVSVFLFFGVFSRDALLLAAPLPALMAFCACYFSAAAENKNAMVFQRAVVWKFLLFIPFLFIGLPWIYTSNADALSGTLMSVIPWTIICFFFLLAGWYYAKTRQPRKWMLHLSWIALLSLLPLAGAFNLLSETLAIRGIGFYLRNELERDDILVQYFMNYPSLYYYTAKESLLVHAPSTPRAMGQNVLDEPSLNRLWKGGRRVFLVLRRRQEYMPPPQEVYNLYETRDLIVLSNRRLHVQENLESSKNETQDRPPGR